MSAFAVNPKHSYVVLPRIGRVVSGKLLLGEHYRQYVAAGLLIEVPYPSASDIALEAPVKKKVLEAEEPRRILEQPLSDNSPVLTEAAAFLQAKQAARVKGKK